MELCRLLQGYGYPVQPGEAVSYGSTPDLTGLDGIHAECKRCEKQALYADCISLYQRQKTAESVKEAGNDPE